MFLWKNPSNFSSVKFHSNNFGLLWVNYMNISNMNSEEEKSHKIRTRHDYAITIIRYVKYPRRPSLSHQTAEPDKVNLFSLAAIRASLPEMKEVVFERFCWNEVFVAEHRVTFKLKQSSFFLHGRAKRNVCKSGRLAVSTLLHSPRSYLRESVVFCDFLKRNV